MNIRVWKDEEANIILCGLFLNEIRKLGSELLSNKLDDGEVRVRVGNVQFVLHVSEDETT